MPEGKFNEEFDVATRPIRSRHEDNTDAARHIVDQRYFLTQEEVDRIEAANPVLRSENFRVEAVARAPSAPGYRSPFTRIDYPPFNFDQRTMPNGSWNFGIFQVMTRSMVFELSYQIIVELAGRFREERIPAHQWEAASPENRKHIMANTLRVMAARLATDLMEVAFNEMRNSR